MLQLKLKLSQQDPRPVVRLKRRVEVTNMRRTTGWKREGKRSLFSTFALRSGSCDEDPERIPGLGNIIPQKVCYPWVARMIWRHINFC